MEVIKYYSVVPLSSANLLAKEYPIRNAIEKSVINTGVIDTSTGLPIWISQKWLLLEGEHDRLALEEISMLGGFNFSLQEFHNWKNEFIH